MTNYRATVEMSTTRGETHHFLLTIPMGAPFTECRAALRDFLEGVDFLEQQEKDRVAQAAQPALQPELPVAAELTD